MSSAFFPLEIQELRRFSSVYTIFVKWFTSIKDIKDLIHQRSNIAPSKMHLFHSSSSKSLSNQTTLHDLGIYQAGHVLRLVLNIVAENQNALIQSKDMEVDDNCLKMLSEVQLGLDHGKFPGKTDPLDCTGGVYFMKSPSNHQVAVFKPSDEEQGMPNNPKGHAGNGDVALRAHFKPGQGYLRETAAYILDQDNFSRVPATTIVHCEHPTFHYPSAIGHKISNPHRSFNNTSKNVYPKIGSLQKFIRASDTFEDISPSLISTLELQKIALLDMRLLNCDRNASNILAIRKLVPSSNSNSTCNTRRDSRSSSMGSYGSSEEVLEELEFNPFAEETTTTTTGSRNNSSDCFELVPIDHGYCIPTKLCIDELDWVWFYCPHVSRPVEPEVRSYLCSLDIDSLLAKLSGQLGMSDDCLFLLRLSHQLIRQGIEAGLTLRDIAELMARTAEEVPSPLENVISAAEDNAHRAIEMRSSRLSHHDSSNNNTNSSLVPASSVIISSEMKTPPLRKNVSLMKFTNTSSDFNMTKSLKTAPTTATSAVVVVTTDSPAGSPKKKNRTFKAIESEPVLDNYEHEADREHADNEEQELRNLRLSSLAKDHSDLVQLTRKISLDFSNTSFNNNNSSSSNSNSNNSSSNNNNSIDNYKVTEDANSEEYFVSDFSQDNTFSPPRVIDNNNNDINNSNNNNNNNSNSVKIGLNVLNFNMMQGKPLTSLKSMDSSFTHVVTAIETSLSSKNSSNNNNNNNYVQPLVASADIRMDFSDQDITSSECGSSPNSLGDHFFLNSRLKFQTSTHNYLEFDNNNNNNNKLQSCVPFQSHNKKDKYEECRSSCDEELNSVTNKDMEINNNKNNNSIQLDAVDRKSPDLSDDNSSSVLSLPPVKLARVISLGAFASPPIYDVDKAERQVTRLRRDKRRNTAKTNEFLELRLTFAMEAIKAVISKEKKAKLRSAAAAN